MHVALALLTLFPGRVGGSEANVRGLLREFANGGGPDRLTVLANRHVMRAYAQAGVPLHHVRSYRSGDSDRTRALAMLAARAVPRVAARDVPEGIDLVHYPVTVPVPVLSGRRTVVTLLDVQHHELPGMFSRAERWLRAWAYDGAARGADRVLTISEHARRGIIEHVGVAPERVEAIPLGVDHARFTPDGGGAPGLAERYVLYPANMWPHKNHERLLAAFDQLGDPTLQLVLTGQTYGREQLLAGRDRVHHLGHIPPDDMPALYRGALALVFPSLFEGFGLPPLEAMACGTPVAASNAGAVAEVCGDAALAFDPHDVDAIAAALARVTQDEPLRARLREAGLARAAPFTWQATAAAHLRAYERALRDR
jgi:glycosyltransferase involved in cell wall biosynthesis